MSFRTLVVGLGQIGMGYDLNHDPNRFILTHSRAFQIHPDFELAGGVDSNPERTSLFQEKYLCPGYTNLEVALIDIEPDIVVISTPTAQHHETVSIVLKTIKPKAILCEKPLAYDLDEAKMIVADCEDYGVKLYVNYIRRSDQAVFNIKNRIHNSYISQPIKGVSWYSKGLLNNGSHFLNLLQYWLGKTTDFKVIDRGRLWDDTDPEPDVQVNFELGTVVFLATREENYSYCNIELISGNGRLRYEQGGSQIFWDEVITDSTYEGYRILNPVSEIIYSDLSRIQWCVADQLSASLMGQEAQICSGASALVTQKVINEIVANL
ncbi:Oxidoreductase-like [Gloeomargarita lithophora Alchichica-D10]|uniref:Oxidoreductase-like n=1 Tax=Gloeomargarita lithophora Alchichica-D10 TaxID=1188229 RepID=A0A1J0AF26_9CYAN|nr:Gfo/Idh/MocA family oxidoreductase [Gloeomargarita lithophora]APB34507.1 Oxidoreductase-like [Gloeomargarita lithophora Alchichica-D10]